MSGYDGHACINTFHHISICTYWCSLWTGANSYSIMLNRFVFLEFQCTWTLQFRPDVPVPLMTCVFLNLASFCSSTYSYRKAIFWTVHVGCGLFGCFRCYMLFSRHESPLEIAQRMKCADMVAWMSEFMVRVGNQPFRFNGSLWRFGTAKSLCWS